MFVVVPWIQIQMSLLQNDHTDTHKKSRYIESPGRYILLVVFLSMPASKLEKKNYVIETRMFIYKQTGRFISFFSLLFLSFSVHSSV